MSDNHDTEEGSGQDNFQKNSTLLLKEETVKKNDETFLSFDPKLNRLLIKYCIFMLFFMSLLALGLVILKKRFNPHKTQPWPGIQSRKHRRRCNNNKSGDSSQVPSISIINSSCPPQPLTYYYTEPRRILWDSFYGPNNVIPSENSSSIVDSAFHGSNLVTRTNSINQDKSTGSKIMCLSTCSPPNYEDIFNADTIIGLPTYDEATVGHPIISNPL